MARTKSSTEVVLGSEIQEKIVNRIYKMQNPSALMGEEYAAALAAYEADRGDLPEVTGVVNTDRWGGYESRGFYRLADGRPVFTGRPKPLSPLAYSYSGYNKSMVSFGRGHARELGVLADSEHNRDIRPDRVERYTQAMLNGEWQDLLSDPITITAEGQVIDGQHRIAAAAGAWGGKYTEAGKKTPSLPPNDPRFLVVWGVSPAEAILADGSRRTEHDGAVIAKKVMA